MLDVLSPKGTTEIGQQIYLNASGQLRVLQRRVVFFLRSRSPVDFGKLTFDHARILREFGYPAL